MSDSSDSNDRAEENLPPQPGDIENRDLFREDPGKSTEDEQAPERTDDELEKNSSRQPPQIDREFIRRVIAPELELYWSRKYGRKLH